MHHFTFSSAIFLGSSFFTSLLTLAIIICHVDYSSLSGSWVVTHCGCDFHSTKDWLCYVRHLIMFVSHLYIYFGGMSIQIVCLYFICVFFLLSSLYIYDTSLLSDIWFVIFSSFSGLFFSLFDGVLWYSKILMQSNLSTFSFIACAFSIVSKKPLPNPRSSRFTSVVF